MKRFLIIFFPVFFLLASFEEGEGTASQAGAIFLSIYPGARPTAMAGAFSSIADDALATYYNDAGLAFVTKRDVVLMHANWLTGLASDLYYEYAAYVHPLSEGESIAGSIIFLSTGKTVPVTQAGVPLSEYTTFDFSVKISYGRMVGEGLAVGVGGRFIYSFLSPDWVLQRVLGLQGGGTGTGWAFDLSTLYETPVPRLNLAASLQNLGPNIGFTESGSSDPLPRTARLGASYRPLDNETSKLIFPSVELTKIVAGEFSSLKEELKDAWIAVGMEYTYSKFLSGRLGYFYDKNGQRIGPTFGAGIALKGFRFDIAVDSEIYDFPTDNYRFSLEFTPD
ncbi:PorV/PorQ family protein [candidate division TA06 bacterium]|nr:PorV/PorQ family protein [candidate division TA06 bacterium]